MKTKIEQLRSWIAESKRIVFFGGAGVSTESGIPDFRSVDGLYHQKFDYPPETIISHSFFLKNPEYFYRFHREKMLPLGFELHGSVLRNYCMKCGKFYPGEFVRDAKGIPRCTCGGIVKPDVVLYEEALDEKTLAGAISAIRHADMLLVGGTSLTVYPAAGLLGYYRGDRLALINRDETPYDDMAGLVLYASLGDVFSQL